MKLQRVLLKNKEMTNAVTVSIMTAHHMTDTWLDYT